MDAADERMERLDQADEMDQSDAGTIPTDVADDVASDVASEIPSRVGSAIRDDDASDLSPGMVEFVESMGRYFEQYGISRIGGRILGLLTIADRPLSLDEIATRLRVSRASVSTNMRVATASDLAQLVTFPGDRRDYYRMIEDAWGHAMRAEIKAIPALRRIAERGLATLGPSDTAAREQLEEMIDFCDFVMERWQGMLDRWQAHREQRRAQRREAAGPGTTRQ